MILSPSYRRIVKWGAHRQPRVALAFVSYAWLASCSPNFDQLKDGTSSSTGGVRSTAGGDIGGSAIGGADNQSGAGGGLANDTAGGDSSSGGDASSFGGTAAASGIFGGSLGGGLGSAGEAGESAADRDAGSFGGTGGTGGSGTAGSGGSATVGSSGSAGLAGTAGASGPNSVCPSYMGMGTLLAPPSTGFETAGLWMTRGHHGCSQTIATSGTGNACEGNAFLSCDGVVRTAEWDGPAIDATANIIYGHTYAVTVALRYSPQSAPTAPSPLTFTCVRACQGGSEQYTDLSSPIDATYNWVRISGQFTASLPGCSQLTEFSFYAGTFVQQKTYKSLDMDDFRIYDLTLSQGGSSGTGGVSGSGFGGAGG